MDDMDEILLKAEIDEITKRIADTMKKLENLDISQHENNPENKDQ
jgi:hypothetical protein